MPDAAGVDRERVETMLLGDPAVMRWPAHGGDTAGLIRAIDWQRHPLGPVSHWPPALRTSIDLMLPAQAQMVVFWGPELITFYNDAYAPTIGLKHPDALGAPASRAWAEVWDDLGPLLRRVQEKGETVAARDRPFQIDRQGFLENVFFDISYSPIRDEAGEVAGVLCIVSETTARVLAAQALIDGEARLRAASERVELALNAGAVIGTWVWDIRNDVFTADERFARTFSLAPQQLASGMPISEVKQSIHPQDTAHVNALIGEALARGGPYSAEYRVRQRDGNWLWIEANGRVELDADGAAIRFPGVLIDIDRRKRTEHARLADQDTLRESEASFRALAQALPNQVWTARPDGLLDWFNQRTIDYSGIPSSASAGTTASTAGTWCSPCRLRAPSRTSRCAGSAPTPTSTTTRRRRWRWPA